MKLKYIYQDYRIHTGKSVSRKYALMRRHTFNTQKMIYIRLTILQHGKITSCIFKQFQLLNYFLEVLRHPFTDQMNC